MKDYYTCDPMREENMHIYTQKLPHIIPLFDGCGTYYHVPLFFFGLSLIIVCFSFLPSFLIFSPPTARVWIADESSQRPGVRYAGRERELGRKRSKSKKPGVKSREWIINKKERQRKQGNEVREDSKYTARKRKPKF